MTQYRICLIGGSGFVGQRLAARLVRAGHHVRVLTRRRERHRELLVLPTAEVVECNVHDAHALTAALAGCDVAINLVGILNERGHDGKGFERAHIELPRKLVAACSAHGIRRLLHMCAHGADANSRSHYQRTKALGEQVVLESGLDVTTFRPSIIYGPGDHFFTMFARLLRLVPLFPLACPDARFQPIFVGDVAECFARAIGNSATHGQRYTLCGPHEYSFLALIEYTARVSGLRRWIVPLPGWASRLQAEVFEYLPGKPFSRDNYWSVQTPNVCTVPFPAVFGLVPVALETVVPTYLAPG